MELLFESRLDIGQLRGKLRQVQQRPQVTEQPVLLPDNAGDGAGASIYGSVFYDQGVYRMWYQGWPRDWSGKNSAIVCYAESDDGITWRKPALDLDDRFESPHNVTDMGLHAPAVFIDPDAPASHRYRATGHTGWNEAGHNRTAEHHGYRTAHSADGLHWTLDQPEPTWAGSDVITSVYHPQQKRGIVALKQNVRSAGIRRRSIWNASLVDGQWQPAHSALVPDLADDLAAQSRGFDSGDYYGMAMQPAGSGTVGFVWQFRHSLPRTISQTGDGAGVFGVVDVSLAYQPDAGSNWLHAHNRRDFLSNQDIPWRPDGCIYTASAPTECGDEHRLYLCATFAHGWYIDAQWNVIDDAKARLINRGVAHIGYAHWPAYRLFGYRSEPQAEIDINLGQLDHPVRLKLNYETHNPDGQVKAAVLKSDTHTLENARPLTGSAIRAQAAWQDGDIIQPTPDGPTAITIALDEATLWAWELEPA